MKALAIVMLLATSAPAVAATAEKPKKERVVCKASPYKTTSRVGSGRVCRTESEWNKDGTAEAEGARDKLDLMTERYSTGDTGGMGSSGGPL